MLGEIVITIDCLKCILSLWKNLVLFLVNSTSSSHGIQRDASFYYLPAKPKVSSEWDFILSTVAFF